MPPAAKALKNPPLGGLLRLNWGWSIGDSNPGPLACQVRAGRIFASWSARFEIGSRPLPAVAVLDLSGRLSAFLSTPGPFATPSVASDIERMEACPDPLRAQCLTRDTLALVSEVTVRDLRNHGGQVIDRVARGERVTITRDGTPVAELRPYVAAKLSAEALLRRWKHLPAIDPSTFRSDLDEIFDSRI
jgi:prevent-host-death family protein